jgi:hypothetical protein
MRQMIKTLLLIVGLALGLQSTWAFSLLGPAHNGGDAWQTTDIGYDPLGYGSAPPFLVESNSFAPKNIGEGYRRNTPVMYYAFGPSFSDYFGSDGETAVGQAFGILNSTLNGLTNGVLSLNDPTNGFFDGSAIALGSTNNIDSYSADLSEFPLNSEGVNYEAEALGLLDLKSETLALMVQQLGLADAVRYIWALRDREHVGNIPCPVGEEYWVIQRNYNITATPLNQIQYSPYVNEELYSYYIYEDCAAPAPLSPPDADALEIPSDPLVNNPPVSSGIGEYPLLVGSFYTGLTRDDVAGLRYLMSTNNYFAPSPAYLESPSPDSAMLLTNLATTTILYTSNLTDLATAAATNDPATLEALFPGLQVATSSNYFTVGFITNLTAYFTNEPGSAFGNPPVLVLATNLIPVAITNYVYSFANVVTNSYYSNTVVTLETVLVTNETGSAFGNFTGTNVVTTKKVTQNIPSGDYFIIPPGGCGYDIISTLYTNVTAITNVITSTFTNVVIGTTNLALSGSELSVTHFTNHWFVVHPCTLETSTNDTIGDYQGIGKMRFVGVRDDNYDYQSGLFINPITNRYTMVLITNGQFVTRTFQRVVTTPDFLFGAADEEDGTVALNINFYTNNEEINLAGPGTINPPSGIIFNKVGPVFHNTGPAFLTQADALLRDPIWASFDGTTNAPIVYPNGTSLTNLINESLIQISPPPPTLPSGTNGVSYSVMFSATGVQVPCTWSLASGSAGLPPGLSLSSNGVISGTPTQTGTYDNIIIQVMDSSTPARTVQLNYSITISSTNN